MTVHLDIEFTVKDIVDWIYQCQYKEDLPALKEIKQAVNGRIRSLESTDEIDIFHSL